MADHFGPGASPHIDARTAAELCFEISEMTRKIEHKADHYQILGIGRRAAAEEIKKAYREQTRKFHPDRNAQLAAFDYQVKSELERIFIRIKEAYETLSDDATRRKYDGMLRFPGVSTPAPSVMKNLASKVAEELPKAAPPEPLPLEEPEDDLAIFDGKAAARLCFEIRELVHKIEQNDDHYQIYGINRRALFKDIQKSHDHLSRKFHPDRVGQLAAFNFQVKSELEKIFARIEEAYEVLSDETKRRKYDAKLRFPGSSTPTPGTFQRPPSGGFSAQSSRQSPPPAKPAMPSVSTEPLRPAPTAPPIVRTASPYSSLHTPHTPAEKFQARPQPVAPPPPPAQPAAPPSAPPPQPDQPASPPPMPSGTTPRLSASEHYLRCVECLGKNDIQRAHQHISRAVEMSPRDAEYRAQLARVLIHMPNSNKQAEEHFLLAIELDKENPDLADLCFEVSRFYRKAGMEKHADEMVQRALALQKGSGAPPSQEKIPVAPSEPAVKGLKGRFQKLVGKILK